MRFFLDFKSDNYGRREIDEPFGVDGIDFSLLQKANGMGRDISFSGGEIMFEFSNTRDHEFKQILYYNRKFGFESQVVLTIEIDENNSYKCDLDFATAETNDFDIFKCKGIEDAKLQIVNARKAVKVNLLATTDIDGNVIQPLVPENMLLLAKPVIQNSIWEQPEIFANKVTAKGDDFGSRVFAYINPAINLTKSEINDSFTFFESTQLSLINELGNDFKLIKAVNNLQKITLSIPEIQYNFTTDVDNGGDGYVNFRLILKYGAEFETATTHEFFLVNKSENQSFDFNGSYNFEIPFLNREDSVWLFFKAEVRQSAGKTIPFVVPKFEFFLNIQKFKIVLKAESIAYNSTAKSFRLIDVMKQVVRSISGLDVNAPRFNVGGQFYENRLINGNFLRNIIDKGFNISLEDIEKSITEFKGDWEIGSDGKVFFGIEQDFYTSIESGFFDNTQFDTMSKTYNKVYSVNKFGFKYNKYQSLKENEENNSNDAIHGETRLVLFNKNVENEKSVVVEWIRDPFLIEETRRKSIEIKENTATQDDDDIYCIDSINTVQNIQFTETTPIQHTYDEVSSRLTLRNDGSINFVSIGIDLETILIINTPDLNAGTYRVFSSTPNELQLNRLLGINTSTGNGQRLTSYTYTIDKDLIKYTNYTNQGFTETENLNSPDSFSNRRYSVATNIRNYYQSYLSTCNLFWKEETVKNANWYKNNGNYTAKYNGVKIKENEDFIPQNPILSPVFYNDIIFANVAFEDFILLQNNIRSQRGFIRTLDNNNQVIKVYPTELKYFLDESKLYIKGEEKFQPTRMTIATLANYILINNETRVQVLKYDFDTDGKLFIYDENRFRLYNGVYWFEVSINGAIPKTIDILKNWLSFVN